ncbi:MAG TPA: hypothetical protein VHA33_16425 [Candidatus Angelobacter sp.]|nr:hypothetical protein [Candidatus Angelobacter sp.]
MAPVPEINAATRITTIGIGKVSAGRIDIVHISVLSSPRVNDKAAQAGTHVGWVL